MRRVSKKRVARNAECKPVRDRLKREIQHCEICGHDPKRVDPAGVRWAMHCHEIARGTHRGKALDRRFALLVVCWYCHEYKLSSLAEWPQSRQLAALKRSRPGDYDLPAFLRLKNPNAPAAITQEEVDGWTECYSTSTAPIRLTGSSTRRGQ